ncbi:MAG: hypothetical protein ACI4T1_04380 [Christensenellales bacterium]
MKYYSGNINNIGATAYESRVHKNYQNKNSNEKFFVKLKDKQVYFDELSFDDVFEICKRECENNPSNFHVEPIKYLAPINLTYDDFMNIYALEKKYKVNIIEQIQTNEKMEDIIENLVSIVLGNLFAQAFVNDIKNSNYTTKDYIDLIELVTQEALIREERDIKFIRKLAKFHSRFINKKDTQTETK